MKLDQNVNVKIDERMQMYLAKVSNVIDCTQAEFIRACIQLAGPQIERHPDLVRLLPFHSQSSSQHS